MNILGKSGIRRTFLWEISNLAALSVLLTLAATSLFILTCFKKAKRIVRRE
jgi:hypothetical protein